MIDTEHDINAAVQTLQNQPEIRIVSAHKITDQQYAIHVGPLGDGRVWMRVIDDYFELDQDQAERLATLVAGYAK